MEIEILSVLDAFENSAQISKNYTDNKVNKVFSDGVGKKTEQGGEIFSDYENNQASGLSSAAFGILTQATSAAQTVVGRGNAEDSEALFIVGNGILNEDFTSVTTPKNAFIIKTNGEAIINGELSFNDINTESAKKAVSKGNGTYELIEDITLGEDTDVFERFECPINENWNGEAYNFSAVRICITAAANPNAGSNAQVIFQLDGNKGDYMIYHQASGSIATSERVTTLVARNDYGMLDYCVSLGTANSPTTNNTRPNYLAKQWSNVSKINLSTHPSGTVLPAGSRIRIYAVRG